MYFLIALLHLNKKGWVVVFNFILILEYSENPMKPARAMPKRSASKNATAMNMRMATIVMASAFNHPQSKKCLTSASQMISTTIDVLMPEKKYVIIPPIRLHRPAIHMASVNFAFYLSAKSLLLN